MDTALTIQTSIPEKVRGFIVDKSSGHPLGGVVVEAIAQPIEGSDYTISLGLLVSDHAGYVSFDLRSINKIQRLEHLWICPVGDDASKIDLVGHLSSSANDQTTGVQSSFYRAQFALKTDGSLVCNCNGNINLLSIQNPDIDDWELSPYSFAAKSNLILGEAGCEVPVPSTDTEREYRFSQVVRTAMPIPSQHTSDMAYAARTGLNTTFVVETGAGSSSMLIAPIEPNKIQVLPTAMPIMYGEVLEFRQTWIPKSHSLGAIIYSLALAPCESVNIAIIDWSREDEASRKDKIVSKENLYHEQRRDRTLGEKIDSALNESQGGWSLMGGLGGAASATIQVEGVPVNTSLNLAVGGGISNSWGNRDLTADSKQELHDTIIQATNVTRSLDSTVVVQATQDESNYLQTRTITNHNHCHALTIQYYEVLRHFKVVTRYITSRRVVLVPYKLLSFDAAIALQYRTILESVLLDPKLSSCFEAILRVQYCSDIYTAQLPKPEGVDTSKASGSTLSGSGTTTDTSSTASGPKRMGDWTVSNAVVNTGVFVKKGSTVQMTATGDVDFGGAFAGLGQVILDADGSSDSAQGYPQPNLRKNSLICNIGSKWYQGGKSKTFMADEDGLLILQPNDNDLKDNSRGWKVEVYVTPPTGSDTSSGSASSGSGILNKVDDMCCQQRLILHLNANLGYYNRAIWLMQDMTDRVMMLNAALAGHPDILNNLDTTPIAVSGNYVAFPYNAEPTKQEEEKKKIRLAENPPSKSIVSLPTRGVFAEAHLSHCNACEVRDVTRFWKWKESPCERPPTIEGITPGPKGQTPTIQPTTLPSPVVQIMQAPAAPDPVGLAAALTLMSQPDIFRDMSGTKEVQQLLSGLASGAVDLAKAQHQQTPEERYDNLQVAKEVAKAAPELGWDEKTTKDVTNDIIGGGRPLLASADAGFVPDGGTTDYWRQQNQPRTVEIKKAGGWVFYDFEFIPTGQGDSGKIIGPASYKGAYKIVKNEPGTLEMDVNIGDDNKQTNLMNVKLLIRNGIATLTGSFSNKPIGKNGVTAIVKGVGTSKKPFGIEFTGGTLQWPGS